MTDSTQPAPVDEPVDGEQGDTAGGGTDPLATDDGLAEVARAGMPEVEMRDVPPGEDAQDPSTRQLLDHPDLDVDHDGVDPCADLGRCDADGGD